MTQRRSLGGAEHRQITGGVGSSPAVAIEGGARSPGVAIWRWLWELVTADVVTCVLSVAIALILFEVINDRD